MTRKEENLIAQIRDSKLKVAKLAVHLEELKKQLKKERERASSTPQSPQILKDIQEKQKQEYLQKLNSEIVKINNMSSDDIKVDPYS